jgi:hypothetical protein
LERIQLTCYAGKAEKGEQRVKGDSDSIQLTPYASKAKKGEQREEGDS